MHTIFSSNIILLKLYHLKDIVVIFVFFCITSSNELFDVYNPSYKRHGKLNVTPAGRWSYNRFEFHSQSKFVERKNFKGLTFHSVITVNFIDSIELTANIYSFSYIIAFRYPSQWIKHSTSISIPWKMFKPTASIDLTIICLNWLWKCTILNCLCGVPTFGEWKCPTEVGVDRLVCLIVPKWM